MKQVHELFTGDTSYTSTYSKSAQDKDNLETVDFPFLLKTIEHWIVISKTPNINWYMAVQMWEKTSIHIFWFRKHKVVNTSDGVMTNNFVRIEKILINPLKRKLVVG